MTDITDTTIAVQNNDMIAEYIKDIVSYYNIRLFYNQDKSVNYIKTWLQLSPTEKSYILENIINWGSIQDHFKFKQIEYFFCPFFAKSLYPTLFHTKIYIKQKLFHDIVTECNLDINRVNIEVNQYNTIFSMLIDLGYKMNIVVSNQLILRHNISIILPINIVNNIDQIYLGSESAKTMIKFIKTYSGFFPTFKDLSAVSYFSIYL